jgi:hypothetical protein
MDEIQFMLTCVVSIILDQYESKSEWSVTSQSRPHAFGGGVYVVNVKQVVIGTVHSILHMYANSLFFHWLVCHIMATALWQGELAWTKCAKINNNSNIIQVTIFWMLIKTERLSLLQIYKLFHNAGSVVFMYIFVSTKTKWYVWRHTQEFLDWTDNKIYADRCYWWFLSLQSCSLLNLCNMSLFLPLLEAPLRLRQLFGTMHRTINYSFWISEKSWK